MYIIVHQFSAGTFGTSSERRRAPERALSELFRHEGHELVVCLGASAIEKWTMGIMDGIMAIMVIIW